MNSMRRFCGRFKLTRETWLWTCIILIILTVVALMLGSEIGTGWTSAGGIPLSLIIALTVGGSILLVVVTVLLIQEHHLCRKPDINNNSLQTSRDRLLNETRKAVVFTDAMDVIVYMNKMAEQLTGQTLQGARGRKLEEVYALQRNENNVSRRMWKAIPDEAGMTTDLETVILNRTADQLFISQQVFHYFDDKGEIKEKVILFSLSSSLEDTLPPAMNVTSGRETTYSKQSLPLAQIAATSGDLCWEWDIHECVMNCFAESNNTFAAIPGNKAEVRQWWRDNIHPEDVKQVQKVYAKSIESGKAFVQQEYRFRGNNGKFRHVLDRASVICNLKGEPVMLVGVMQDITAIKQEERRLAEAVLNAQEAERKTIGGELHDNINQILATSVLQLSLINEYAQDPGKVRELVKLTKGQTMKAIDEIRKLSHELSPVRLDDTDLEECIRDLLGSFNADQHFSIEFHFDDQVREWLTDEMQLHFYRILQEQLKNIRKHAGASGIFISVSKQPDLIELVITDNGKGFDTLVPSKGIGLANIRRRVHSMGGCVVINSAPGAGVQLRVRVKVGG